MIPLQLYWPTWSKTSAHFWPIIVCCLIGQTMLSNYRWLRIKNAEMNEMSNWVDWLLHVVYEQQIRKQNTSLEIWNLLRRNSRYQEIKQERNTNSTLQQNPPAILWWVWKVSLKHDGKMSQFQILIANWNKNERFGCFYAENQMEETNKVHQLLDQ